MNLLFVTPELAGYFKAGGLADVSAAIPHALRQRGVDARILMPFYGAGRDWRPSFEVIARLNGMAEIPPCDLAVGDTREGTPAFFILCPPLYERPGTPYTDLSRRDWPDNDIRFARLALAAVQIITGEANTGWRPDVVHANDWPSGLCAAYLKWRQIAVPCLFTIHNLAYQGLVNPSRMTALGIPPSAFSMHGVEFHGRVSFMKAGLFYADHVSTVSPTYAGEITTEEFGGGLHGLLRALNESGRLAGILNGAGDDWAPQSDKALIQNYPPRVRQGKQRNAAWLRETAGLEREHRPLFAMVSRLVHQKGVDLALEAVETIVAGGGQFFLLGEGEPGLEELARDTAAQFAGSAAVMIAFDETLSRRVIAASDFYLMPSRFEPCGLNQMYAERYGSLPIAHATGGLVDSIRDGETGFLCTDPTPVAVRAAIIRALKVYIRPGELTAMSKAAMAQDFGWGPAAAQYEQLYKSLLASSRYFAT
jgi:starch synthase